ncbi:ERF family protein [Borreliella lusitaniae]|uniref:ERF family protein n=2 Tax=Borreliella lusitaniae TaxID=100177 RepID=A0ACD5GME4_9SPIR
MKNVSKKNTQENIQAKINFKKDMKTLRMNLAGIEKNLKGYGYKYQNFNEIVREIKNVIEKHNLDLDFDQFPTFTVVEGQTVLHVVRTTFYSISSDYQHSFDTPMLTENLQWNNENGSKNVNTVPQLVGSSITYFKRYALVAYLNIESEVDTDAAPIYNNYENENSLPSKQISVNKEQKKDINQNPKKNRFYYYKIFKEALSNIKNWVNESTVKENINSIVQAICAENEAALHKHFMDNPNLKTIEYWAGLVKDYFKKNNRLDDLNRLEVFMSFNQPVYGNSPLKFFCALKEEKQFDYIFTA